MTVAIVTDSTSTIPSDLIKKYDIRVGPQIVIWDEETLLDGIDIQAGPFYERLSKSPTIPTTSQCSIPYFQKIFQDLVDEGKKDILCVLISSKLSGTIGSAEQAKELVPEANVEIVDSMTVAMALGYQVLEAAEMAASGASLVECKQAAEGNIGKTGVFITPETLEFLHRGGRIGGGAKFLATALNIKPVLEVQHGRLEAVERVRTRKKVIRRIAELVSERIGGARPVRLTALHANSPVDAQMLLDEAAALLNPEDTFLSEVSPAIGVHTGPGTIGLCWYAG
ncbi:MAG TPA: DegV family protein [Anaerolineales bacterium]|nr:DegV family protein [Anaerolineales bacterium]